MKLFFLILILITFSCMVEFYDNSSIGETSIFIRILDDTSYIYHIYFENINCKTKSKGQNLNNKNYITFKIYPGIYNIYIYRIVPKTDSSFCVDKYKVLKNIKIVNKKSIELTLEDLYPDFKFESNNNEYIIKIYMDKIYEIFGLSSISIKQGDDKVRSILCSYSKEENIYYSIIPFYQQGDWFMNISFYLKSKVDSNELEKDNIYISTTYLKNIFLGTVTVN